MEGSFAGVGVNLAGVGGNFAGEEETVSASWSTEALHLSLSVVVDRSLDSSSSSESSELKLLFCRAGGRGAVEVTWHRWVCGVRGRQRYSQLPAE